MKMEQTSLTLQPEILVVDDDPLQRLLLSEALREQGYRVREADGGRAALEEVRAGKPDLVLLDIVMPDMDGYDACRQLRCIELARHLPILMLTGLDDVESINQAYDSGATDFIAKPINLTLLGHRLKYMLRFSSTMSRLLESEADLAQAQEIAQLGSWVWDVDSGQLRCSVQVPRIFGLDDSTRLLARRDLLECVHPDDRERVAARLEAVEARPEPYPLEYRLLLPDGTLRHLVEHGEPMDEAGNGRLIRGTVQEITQRIETEAEMRRLAYHDVLTGLPNRALFREMLGHALANCQRYGGHFAVLCMDLDNFNQINDTLGHTFGDQLLEQVARRLERSIRESDVLSRAEMRAASADLSRFGGDEFCVLVTGIHKGEDAGKVAQRLVAAMRKPYSVSGREVYVTASVGVACFPEDADDAERLLMNAEAAMFHAKQEGRDRAQFYSPDMNATAMQRLTVESYLRQAVRLNQLSLRYQPLVDAKTRRITSMEALLRWSHPELGAVSPAVFIPIAEETGMIGEIGRWVMYEACMQMRRWRDAGVPLVRMAINMSTLQFRDEGLLEQTADAIKVAGISPELLELEVTESTLMRDTESVLDTLSSLKALGVAMAIDDFGTGYSSLAYLRRFPLDTLKVDRSFVRNLQDDADNAAIVLAIISLARCLGMQTVAEGVETEGEAAFLQAHDCDILQGFLFAQPLEAAAMAERLLAQGEPPQPD